MFTLTNPVFLVTIPSLLKFVVTFIAEPVTTSVVLLSLLLLSSTSVVLSPLLISSLKKDIPGIVAAFVSAGDVLNEVSTQATDNVSAVPSDNAFFVKLSLNILSSIIF